MSTETIDFALDMAARIQARCHLSGDQELMEICEEFIQQLESLQVERQ